MGSVNAIGGAPTYEHMRVLLKSLFDPKLEQFAITEPYQVVSVFPIGAEYLHVRDQAMNSIESLAGKKVSVMNGDASETVMMEKMGLQATGASIANFVRPFNNGEVDALVAPAMVYSPWYNVV
jgi:TRAP-type C4-dicarboxylate transport system substrate-binding protein